MANLAALRAAVFSLSAKNLTGGGVEINPPAGARVNWQATRGLFSSGIRDPKKVKKKMHVGRRIK